MRQQPTIIGSDGGSWPGGHQAIIWTNAEILLIGPWEQLQWILIKVTHFIHQGKYVWLLKPPPSPQYSSAELYVY